MLLALREANALKWKKGQRMDGTQPSLLATTGNCLVTVFERPTRGVSATRFVGLWLSLSACVVAIGFLIDAYLIDQKASWSFLGIFIPQSIGLFGVPLAVLVCTRLLCAWTANFASFIGDGRDNDSNESPASRAKKAFRLDLSGIAGNTWMYGCGFFVGTAATLVFYFSGYIGGFDLVPGAALLLLITVSGCFAGMGLYAVYVGGRAIWRLGAYPVRVELHPFGILMTGTLLAKCFFIVAIAWSAFTISAVPVGTKANVFQHLFNEPMYLLAWPTASFIILAFIVCQIPLHRQMVSAKRQQILRLSKQIAEIEPQEVGKLTPEVMDKMAHLKRELDFAASLPEWPASMRASLGVVGSSLSTVLVPAFWSGLGGLLAKKALADF